MLRVGHYLNQFFAGFGGEEHANMLPESRDGPAGPGRLLQTLLRDEGNVVSTFMCGDNFFNEQLEPARTAVRTWLDECRPDLVVAGPAFAAGRYGSACTEVCRLSVNYGIPAVTGMHPENPGLLIYRKAYVVPTGDSATDMAPALTAMIVLGRKLASGDRIGPAEREGYLPRGVRRPGLREHSGADRAVDMLIAKLKGHAFRTELPVEKYEAIPPAPAITDLHRATIAALTTGAIVPKGNPDHLKRASEDRWRKYNLAGLDALTPDRFECVHGGFFNAIATENPNLVLPLDVLRELEHQRVFSKLLDFYCVTSGNDQRLADCITNGREIAQVLRAERVHGALLVAT